MARHAAAKSKASLEAWLGALLASPLVRDLRGSALFAIALYLSGETSMTVDQALDVLYARGLPANEDRERLYDRVMQSTRADVYFRTRGHRFRVHSPAHVEYSIAVLREDLGFAVDRYRKRARELAVEPAPRPAPVIVATPAAPEPEPEPIPAPPEAPASVAAVVERLAMGDVERALAGRAATIADVAHVLAAHALSAAQQFDDLLSPAALRGIEALRHQTEAVRRVLRALGGRALLADEVGLGKTIEAIMVLREYQLRGMAKRVLILVPAALVRQWCGELAERAGVEARSTDGGALRREGDAFWRGPGVVVASIATARMERYAAALAEERWDLVIVDEAHHLKNRATAGWKLVNGIRARFLLLVTATPVQTDLDDLYSLVTLLKPGQLPPPAAFRREFVDRADPTAPRNRERLRRLLSEVMVRNTRAQSGLKLPPRFVTTVLADPLDGEAALYADAVALLRGHAADAGARRAASLLLLEAGSSPRAVRSTLERMAASGRHAGALQTGIAQLATRAASVSETRKAELLADIVRAHREPVLVFTRYRATQAQIAEELARAGVAHELFHGDMTLAEKSAAIDRFRAGTGVLVATDVGAEGQNLQFARVLVNFDLPMNPMLVEQRIGRLHRIGQTSEVRVYNLALRGTIEERVLEVLDGRLHLFELVVGEMDMILGNLADERDLEERVLDLYATSGSDAEIAEGFDQLARELEAARGHYEQSRALDQALFGEDYES